ncbi:MAG TPA: alpha/beta hydrolase [Anaerolineae bacterium]|nr:alpha/beta hydrolase [Anaerolineae bacterium]HMR65635.1 alpha/beta hydrolase [Anaerolineae bacterium]
MHVMLIHGQGRTPWSMRLLGYRLKRRGCLVHYFGYAAWAESFAHITDRFVRTVQRKVADYPYLVVSHSLGGLITRAALPRLRANPPRQLIMLAPPNRSPWLAKRLAPNRVYRLLTGDCGQKLADESFYQVLPVPQGPVTIIAGTRNALGLLSPLGGQANDTILTVDETRLAGIEVVQVAATHAFIMNSSQVAEIILSLTASLSLDRSVSF